MKQGKSEDRNYFLASAVLFSRTADHWKLYTGLFWVAILLYYWDCSDDFQFTHFFSYFFENIARLPHCFLQFLRLLFHLIVKIAPHFTVFFSFKQIFQLMVTNIFKYFFNFFQEFHWVYWMSLFFFPKTFKA